MKIYVVKHYDEKGALDLALNKYFIHREVAISYANKFEQAQRYEDHKWQCRVRTVETED